MENERKLKENRNKRNNAFLKFSTTKFQFHIVEKNLNYTKCSKYLKEVHNMRDTNMLAWLLKCRRFADFIEKPWAKRNMFIGI